LDSHQQEKIKYSLTPSYDNPQNDSTSKNPQSPSLRDEEIKKEKNKTKISNKACNKRLNEDLVMFRVEKPTKKKTKKLALKSDFKLTMKKKIENYGQNKNLPMNVIESQRIQNMSRNPECFKPSHGTFDVISVHTQFISE
jgi:hypothetical protein